MSLCKGSENKELYLNVTSVVQDLIQNKTLYSFMIEDGFIKGLLDLLNEDDTQRFVCVCKLISNILAQLKKNSSQISDHKETFFDDEDDVMLDDKDDEEVKKEKESDKIS